MLPRTKSDVSIPELIRTMCCQNRSNYFNESRSRFCIPFSRPPLRIAFRIFKRHLALEIRRKLKVQIIHISKVGNRAYGSGRLVSRVVSLVRDLCTSCAGCVGRRPVVDSVSR